MHVFLIRLSVAELANLRFIDFPAAEMETAPALLKMSNNSASLFVQHHQQQVQLRVETLPLRPISIEPLSFCNEIRNLVHTAEMLVELVHEPLQGLRLVT